MSYEINWYIPQRVLLIHLTGELDLNAVEAMARDTKTMLEQGTAPVHILLDDTLGGAPPKSLREMKVRMETVKDSGVGWVVGIGEVNAVAQFLVPFFMKIVRINFVRHTTLEDAVQFLVQRDITLQNQEA